MTTVPPESAPRRLLINGERLTERVVRVSSGGPKFEPRTFSEAQSLLQPQLATLLGDAASIPDGYRTERVVFEATVLPNYLANSYFPDRLLAQTGVTALGSRRAEAPYRTKTQQHGDKPTKALLLAGDGNQLAKFERLLRGHTEGRSERVAADEFVQFERLALSQPTITAATSNDDETGELFAFEAVLHPDPDQSTLSSRVPASAQTLRLLAAVVDALDGSVATELITDIGGLTFVPLRLTRTGERALRQFNPLRALRPMPRLRPLRTAEQPASTTTIAPPGTPASADAPVVYVFDGGIDPHGPIFAGSTSSTDLVSAAMDSSDQRHGEAVVSTVLYGPVVPGRPLPVPVAQVKHYRVTPTEPDETMALPLMLRSIEETLAGTDGALVNLSVGPDGPIEDDEPHEWTALLDTIAYEQGTMFVSAPGNDGDKSETFQLNRVQAPADMVNGLSVGACDVAAPLAPWQRTPYSPVGPGRLGASVQPTVVAFGGTTSHLFHRLDANGALVQDAWGTSYAAPQITHSLAQLRTELGQLGTAPTLRAFTIHGAERLPNQPNLHELGYGRALGSFNELLSCEPNRVTVLYQGTVARDEVRAFYLPIPDDLQKGHVDVHCTLSFVSPTDPTEAAEYTKAALDRTFRPHALRYRYSAPSGNTASPLVRHQVTQRDAIDDLLQAGWSTGLNPASDTLTSTAPPEHISRDQGRWETVWDAKKRYLASSLHRPRLDLSHISRAAGQLTRGGDEIDFSLLVTVRARADYPLYERVTEQYVALDALPLRVPVSGIENQLET